MNGTTLKALRLALGFTQEEASNMIGSVSMRTWRYWEDEGRKIPDDVQTTIRNLIELKIKLVREFSLQLESTTAKLGIAQSVCLTYYSTLDDWMTQDGATGITWRPHCMAMSAICEIYPTVDLIKFDAVDYQKWLGTKQDNSASRSLWAVQVNGHYS